MYSVAYTMLLLEVLRIVINKRTEILKRLQFRKCTSFFILMSCLLVLHGSLNASALCCDAGRQMADEIDTCCSCCELPPTPAAKTDANTLSTLNAYPISDQCVLCYDTTTSSSPDECYISLQNTLSHPQASMVVFTTSAFEKIVDESFPPQPSPAVNYMLTSLSTVVLLI
jgi:hypothetical protein